MDKAKPFSISRRLFMYAYQKVRSNKGAGGVDGMSLDEFEQDYKNHLYKLWNRMSSGSYMPPPVRLKEEGQIQCGLRLFGVYLQTKAGAEQPAGGMVYQLAARGKHQV